MTLPAILIHLFSFCAPALFLALLMPLLARSVIRKKNAVTSWWMQMLIQLIVGVGVLFAGLWWLGRDGRMLTYVSLVLMATTTQWLLLRAWRK